MSDYYENIVGFETAANRVCMCAYTLNDTQPVQCTIIGDQPLFYMDFEDDIIEEEDGYYDGDDFAFLESEIETLKREISSLEESFTYAESLSAQRTEEFLAAAGSLDEDVTVAQNAIQKQNMLSELKETLSQSRLAAAYMELADEHKLQFVMSRQVEKSFFDRRSGTILINPDLQKEEQVLLFARELRRHWQYRQGILINPMMFQPENAILVGRAQEADLTISMIRIAWELQLAGNTDVWERIDNSPMGDLARAFAREAFMDFRTINNGEAAAAVFEAWFLSERCRQQDKKLIQGMLADYKGYVFEHIEASKSVTAELIAALGSMPYGKNYLAPHAVTIMEDPVFNEVRDRSNANFLWFIKFERSFKETEQELQTESGLSTCDVRHDLVTTVSQDPKYENQKSAEIIQLFAEDDEGRCARDTGRILSDKGSKSGHSAEIIDFRRWSQR